MCMDFAAAGKISSLKSRSNEVIFWPRCFLAYIVADFSAGSASDVLETE